jgi:hypothetical protein
MSADAQFRTFGRRGVESIMAAIHHLPPGEQMPDHGEEEPWLIIEASDDGRFFGTGSARKSSGEWVFYASLPENDNALDSALAAAERWAAKYNVPIIWVQTTP